MLLTKNQRIKLADLCFDKARRLRQAGQDEPSFLLAMEEKAQEFEYLAYRLLQGF